METTLYADRFESRGTPIGELGVAVDEEGVLVRVTFLGGGESDGLERELARRADRVVWLPGPCATVREQLEEYLEGERREFDLAFSFSGTPFQESVWRALCEIPFGETQSYGELAERLGSPGSSRAVGQANHVNPLPIVVPCHRVTAATGELAGFGGGIPVQRALLDLERGQRTLQHELFD